MDKALSNTTPRKTKDIESVIKKLSYLQFQYEEGEEESLDHAIRYVLNKFVPKEILDIWWYKEFENRRRKKYQKKSLQRSIGALITLLIEEGCSQNISFKAIAQWTNYTSRHVANCYYEFRDKFTYLEPKAFTDNVDNMYLFMAHLECWVLLIDPKFQKPISPEFPTVSRAFQMISNRVKEGNWLPDTK